MQSSARIPIALTIAGSDSGGGAGIQADLKTFAAFGVHGVNVITCVTAQNPRRVFAIQPIHPKIIRAQLRAIFDELPPRAIKIGMLCSASVARAVVEFLEKISVKHLVLDPVMKSSSGVELLDAGALKILRNKLIPMATLLTPNLAEAELLSGRKIKSLGDMREVAQKLSVDFGCATLVKGGHLPTAQAAFDVLCYGKKELMLRAPFVRGIKTHGTGCTLSAAITACLAKGLPLPLSVKRAKSYTRQAIACSHLAASHPVLNHQYRGSER